MCHHSTSLIHCDQNNAESSQAPDPRHTEACRVKGQITGSWAKVQVISSSNYPILVTKATHKTTQCLELWHAQVDSHRSTCSHLSQSWNHISKGTIQILLLLPVFTLGKRPGASSPLHSGASPLHPLAQSRLLALGYRRRIRMQVFLSQPQSERWPAPELLVEMVVARHLIPEVKCLSPTLGTRELGVGWGGRLGGRGLSGEALISGTQREARRDWMPGWGQGGGGTQRGGWLFAGVASGQR